MLDLLDAHNSLLQFLRSIVLDLLNISTPGLAYICLGGFVVVFCLFSLVIKEKLYLNEVVLGTALGILIGPFVGNIFNPRDWTSSSKSQNNVTLEVMRIVLGTGLFAIGVELPGNYMWKHSRSLLAMVIPTMAAGWILIGGILKLLFPSLTYVSCLAISACLTPTDPIICAAIVGGKFAEAHVPLNLRHILAAESAANDGLAYPFLSISIYLTLESSKSVAFGKWFLVGWLYQVIFGVVLGAAMGLLFSYLFQLSKRRGFVDRESYVAQYVATTLLTVGVAQTIGSDDLLAAFAAGTAMSWDGHFNEQTEGEVFVSVIDFILNSACFIYIGAWIPFQEFNSPDLGIVPWRLTVLFIVIVFLRRIPALMVLYKWIPEITSWQEALFSGHFGPMGVGAVFISTLALTELPTPHNPPQNQVELLALYVQPVVAFIVLGSIIVHGLSIPLMTGVQARTVSLPVRLTTPSWVFWSRLSKPGAPFIPDIERDPSATPSTLPEQEPDSISAVSSAYAGPRSDSSTLTSQRKQSDNLIIL
ncbi:Sodium/hydrogen exchanger family-domain-containing protein [Rhodocollybia butyracea]|uniref:Sodium/hydrogen exchanger family-domain-containing protein n=1 Tax=Rhodocollybia butyracea TaxID=206335 RepID=A0A9P5PXJ4_9AGAR|nr:Sodium/hydrogen exchanger family-domain-containing protein [Rhodocollybia butyracea]